MFKLMTIVNNVYMSKFKFVNIIDTVFISIATFLIFFAWVQFFVKNFLLSILIGSILSISVILILRWFKLKKSYSTQAKVAHNTNLICFKLAIQTMPTTKLSTLIKKQLSPNYLPKINKGDINFVKNNISYTYTFYYASELTESKLLEIIKTKPAKNITIFCSNVTQDVKTLALAFKNKQIQIITLEQLFEIFNSKNISIDTSHIDLNKHKITLREILKNSISRNKSKGYFISGLVLLFTSIIIPYKIYYVVFSSALFTLSLVCRLRPTVKSNHSIFD